MSIDNRIYRRLIDAVDENRIIRDPHTWEYTDNLHRLRDVDTHVYDMEERGWLLLHRDGRVEVTNAGRSWRLGARAAAADPFQAPGVAA